MIELAKAVIQKNNQYLLLKRTVKSKNFPELWDFPGGKLEPGETPTQAIIREVEEETALVIIPEKEIKTTSFKRDHLDLFFHYFTPSNHKGNIQLSPDHTAFKWVKKEQMSTLNLHPSVIEFFK